MFTLSERNNLIVDFFCTLYIYNKTNKKLHYSIYEFFGTLREQTFVFTLIVLRRSISEGLLEKRYAMNCKDIAKKLITICTKN